MPQIHNHRLKNACTVSLLLIATSCATTINESAPTTLGNSADKSTVVTIDLQLGRDELLVEMLQKIDDLSKEMQKVDRKDASQLLKDIELIGAKVRPEILMLSDQLATDFDRIIALAKSSVERTRPADADKALRFLPLIIESIQNF